MTALSAGWHHSVYFNRHIYNSRACCAQLLVAERGPLVFVFNFSPFNDYADYKVRAQHAPAPLAVIHCQLKVACPQISMAQQVRKENVQALRRAPSEVS